MKDFSIGNDGYYDYKMGNSGGSKGSKGDGGEGGRIMLRLIGLGALISLLSVFGGGALFFAAIILLLIKLFK